MASNILIIVISQCIERILLKIGGNTPQNVTIYGQDVDEYDEGKLGLEEDYLSGLFHINAGITGISDDEKYSSLLIDNQSVSLWNTDNDTAGVVFASIDNNSKESWDNGTLEVRLRSRPYDNVTVSLSADNHTRLGETLGIKLVPEILTFTSSGIDNWTVPQTVQVVSLEDNFDEGEYSHDNQTFNVWLNSVSIIYDNVSITSDNSSTGNDKVAPGTVIGKPLIIACNGGALEIVSLQRPGKSVQTAEDFLRGFPIQIGSTFE